MVLRKKSGELGFTLMEVTMAILILAASLGTLIGLQSAVIRRSARDKQSQLAMLVARRILAGIEIREEIIQDQETTETVDKLVKEYGKAELDDQAIQDLSLFEGKLSVRTQTLPTESALSFKRLTLEIIWGENSIDRLQVLYFLPGETTAGGLSDQDDEDQ